MRKAKKKIKEIDGLLGRNSIDVNLVKASRIAVAKEFEDEGDLYIVECTSKDILYLWDNDYNLKKNFPCLEFEIYSEDFYNIMGRQINPLSERIKPIVIDAKTKWAYLKKVGGPVHLTTERETLDLFNKTFWDKIKDKFYEVPGDVTGQVIKVVLTALVTFLLIKYGIKIAD